MPYLIKIAHAQTITAEKAAAICHVTPRTIYRYEKEGWPKLAEKMIYLFDNGMIMPNNWTHAKFNSKGNLELHNGEICENEVLNLPYMRVLNDKLRREFEHLKEENQQLRAQINALDNSAANDSFA